jgi:two-component system response regulator YesN
MLKAIIVDDEEIVRTGLRRHFHWDAHNIMIVGDFPDGASAFSYLKNNEVNLIITDVVMPVMNGLELATRARKLYPDVKLIFVSGYTDAQYLLEALKLNATDFIFKSIDFNELDQAIERACSNIHKENEHRSRLENLEKQVQENKALLIQQQYVSLLSSSVEHDLDEERSCAALGIPLNNHSQYILMVIRLSNKWRILEKSHETLDFFLDFEVLELIKEILRPYEPNIVFKSASGEFVCILDTSEKTFENMLMGLSIEIQAKLKKTLDAELLIGLSSIIKGLSGIHEAYLDTCQAIAGHQYVDSSLPLVSMSRYTSSGERVLKDKARLLISNVILDGDKKKITEAVSSLIHEADPNEKENFLVFLLLVPAQLLENLPSEERGWYSDSRDLLQRYMRCKDDLEKQDFILGAFFDASEKTGKPGNVVVSSVLDYVDRNFMNQISVTSIAESVRMSPAYLCVLFKQNTGQTINQYITQLRVSQAMSLLKEGSLAVEEVCYKVGYLSTSYFSRLFRQTTGMTPSEYRNSLLSSRGMR